MNGKPRYRAAIEPVSATKNTLVIHRRDNGTELFQVSAGDTVELQIKRRTGETVTGKSPYRKWGASIVDGLPSHGPRIRPQSKLTRFFGNERR